MKSSPSQPVPAKTIEAAVLARSVPKACAPLLILIEPGAGWRWLDLAELWRYRELLYALAWRDIKVRYKQTVLGAAWAVLQPALATALFVIFLGRLGEMDRHVEGNYMLFVYSAMLPWTLFSAAVNQAALSLPVHANMIGKVYFPRLIVPLAAVGSPLVDIAVSLVLLLVLQAWFGTGWPSTLILLPAFFVAVILAAVGAGTLLAALVAAYRDFRYVVTFLLQAWMFATPIAYPVDIVPRHWQWLYAVNPTVGLIDGFRAAALGTGLHWETGAISLLSTLLLLALGLWYFGQVERRFADIL